MNTIYFTEGCKRRQRIGDTLIIRTDDAVITITAGARTRVDTVYAKPEPARKPAAKPEPARKPAAKPEPKPAARKPLTEDARRALSGCGPIVPVTDRTP